MLKTKKITFYHFALSAKWGVIMEKKDYLKILVEQIHSTTIATIGADGHPQTRVIDMMLGDENGVYFLTAKGKAFYAQLMEQKCIDITKKPVEIDQNHCLHCGRCAEICPKQVIVKRGQ